MSFRIRSAIGLGLLLALVTSLTVFAKGGFTFISIAGPGLEEAVRSTDKNLTEDYFAFANFYLDKVEAPASPGVGYEITRYYVDGKRETPFDRLHYYPASGFVYYDGIVNGSSEYDGEWYTANPNIQTVFESALSAASIAGAQSAQPAKQVQPVVSIDTTQPLSPIVPSRVILPVSIIAGLMVLVLFAFRLRKPSAQ
jgi:hypothetical protein